MASHQVPAPPDGQRDGDPTLSRLCATESAFRNWLARAAPGDTVEYHRGHLAVDRTRVVSAMPEQSRIALDRLAAAAFAAAEQGWVHLVQRRHGPDGFSYLAIARRRAGILPRAYASEAA